MLWQSDHVNINEETTTKLRSKGYFLIEMWEHERVKKRKKHSDSHNMHDLHFINKQTHLVELFTSFQLCLCNSILCFICHVSCQH